jgi:endonuclease YncB( thermonuclease family)
MRRIRKRHFALSVIFALAVYVVQELTRPEIYGMAAGIDGDTLEIDGQRIRLYGIDTPERRQTCQNAASIPYPCGQTAADFLREAMDGRPLRCVVMDHDRYSRLAARCFAGDTSVNAQLVRAGWALAYTEYSCVMSWTSTRHGPLAPACGPAGFKRRGIFGMVKMTIGKEVPKA